MRRRGGEEGGERRGEREEEDVAQFAFASQKLRLFCTQFGVMRESGGVGLPTPKWTMFAHLVKMQIFKWTILVHLGSSSRFGGDMHTCSF